MHLFKQHTAMKRLSLFFLCSVVVLSLQAQTEGDDFGGLISTELSWKMAKRAQLSFEEELRTQQHFSKLERSSSTLGLSFKLSDHFKLGAAYNFIYQQYYRPKKDLWQWEIRQRYYTYATASWDVNRFEISLRERFQSTYRQSKDYKNPKNYLRSRISVDYDIRRSPFQPYASAEMYYLLKSQESGINRWRYTAGCEYKIDKKNQLDFFYRYTTFADDDNDEENGHMLGLCFKHRF